MKRGLMLIALILMALALTLAACGAGTEDSDSDSTASVTPAGETAALAEPAPTATVASQGLGQGHRMGAGGGMMGRHHISVPAPYAGLTNPVKADQVSLDRGAEQYSTLCASCHGDGGMGDGPAGANLDPAPAPVAHTSQMLGDDLLFWRISEGGLEEPFGSAMPAWKDSLDEETRWDLVNYMRALGQGQVQPQQAVGGAAFDPDAEQAHRAEMLAEAVQQGVINQEEAEVFDSVHGAMDDLIAAGGEQRLGGMGQMRDTLTEALVEAGTITQEQADAFNEIHDRLELAGLME
jgi:mono/diheme cytochrome c family protein